MDIEVILPVDGAGRLIRIVAQQGREVALGSRVEVSASNARGAQSYTLALSWKEVATGGGGAGALAEGCAPEDEAIIRAVCFKRAIAR